jgi:hypothetical protein
MYDVGIMLSFITSLHLSKIISTEKIRSAIFLSTGDWTNGLTYARQGLHHLSCDPIPFTCLFSLFVVEIESY